MAPTLVDSEPVVAEVPGGCEPALGEVPVDSEASVVPEFDWPVDNEPAEVDGEDTEPLDDDTPVDSEPCRIGEEMDEESLLSDAAVEVDSEATEFESVPAAVLRLLDSEATAALVWNSWLPFTASVLPAEIRPAARPVNCRSKPRAPMFTVPTGLLPAKLPKVLPPIVAELTGIAAEAIEPLPMATELSAFAVALGPIAMLSTPLAIESLPVAFVWKYLMPVELMLSSASPTLSTFAVVPSALWVV